MLQAWGGDRGLRCGLDGNSRRVARFLFRGNIQQIHHAIMVRSCAPKLRRHMCSCRRDAAFIGEADDGVQQLCRHLGWEKELQSLIDAS